MPATTGNGGSGEATNGEISPELVRKVADRVYEMLRLELKLDNERQRFSRRDKTNRQRRGRI